MASPFKIVLADDHVMFRRGVRSLIQGMDNVEVVGEAGDGIELLRLLKDIHPNLVILDISMPNLRGLEATREIKILNPGIKVMILSMHKEREYLYHALCMDRIKTLTPGARIFNSRVASKPRRFGMEISMITRWG